MTDATSSHDVGTVDEGSDDASGTDATDAPLAVDAFEPDVSVPECRFALDCVAPSCRVASCVAGRCVDDPAPDGTACDDGDLCTSGDRCSSGACVSTARLTCAVCTRDVPGTYLVSFAAVRDKNPHALTIEPDGAASLVGFGDGDLWFARVPADGVGATERQYGHPRGGDSGYAITTLRDGGVLLAGYSQVGGGPSLPWTVRTDAVGGPIATQSFFADRGGSFLGAVELSDGGFVLLANLEGRAALTKITVDGSVMWTREYFTLHSAYETSSLVQLADGGFAFAAQEQAGVFGTAHVVRTDANGLVRWDRTYTRSTADYLLSILPLADGTLAVGGMSAFTHGGSAWLMHLDASGAELWSRYYGTDINASVTGIARTADGGFVLASRENDDAWIIRTDAEGQQIERATLALGGDEEATAIAVASDGSIVIAGSSRRGAGLPRDGWLARVTDLGSLACGSD